MAQNKGQKKSNMNAETQRMASDFASTFGTEAGQKVLKHLADIYKDRFMAGENADVIIQKAAQHDVILYCYSMIDLARNEPGGSLQ